MSAGNPALNRDPINGYDAADSSSARSSLYFPFNSRLEYNQWTRRRLLEKNRALESNFSFITRIKSKFGRCVAGKGIFPFPTTNDAEWNAQARQIVMNWASNPHTYSIDASRTMWEDQRIVAEELGAGDGETISLFIDPKKNHGVPTIQPLDPFEVGTPWVGTITNIPLDPLLYQDGVMTDDFMRPLLYLIQELPALQPYLPTELRAVNAESVIHVFRRRRAKQLRGIPPLYSGMNDGHDALDTLALAKASAKLHSLLAVTKRKRPDQASGKGLGEQIKKVLDADGNLSHLEEQFKGGAVTVELKQDEELQLHASQRPTMAEIDGIKFYCHLIALAGDLPFSVVFSFLGVNGTATRADLEDAQSTFEMRQDHLIWSHSERIYNWRVARAMLSKELRQCRDPYWWACDWHGPAKITTDYGRSAQANIDLMKSGLLSAPRYFEERGQDAITEMRKQVDFLAEAKAYCAQKGVEFSLFMEPTPGSTPKPGNDNPGEEDPKEE